MRALALSLYLATLLASEPLAAADRGISSLSARAAAHEAAGLDEAAAALRRRDLAAIRSEDKPDSLRVALAEAALAQSLRHIFGEGARAPALAEARRLLGHAAPILAAALPPDDLRARRAAEAYWSIVHDEPDFADAPAYVSLALSRMLPAKRLPSRAELAVLADPNPQARRAEQRRILDATFGPGHLATAEFEAGSCDGAALRKSGLPAAAEAGFKRIAELKLHEEDLHLFDGCFADLVNAGFDDDAVRLARQFLAGMPADKSVRVQAKLLRFQSRPIIRGYLQASYRAALEAANLPPAAARLVEAEVVNIKPQAEERARAALAAARDAGPADAVLVARAQALLASRLAGADDAERRSEARDLASQALAVLVPARGPVDPDAAKAWQALAAATRTPDDPASKALADLSLHKRAPAGRLPTLDEARRIAALDKLAHGEPATEETLAAAAELVALEEVTIGVEQLSAARDVVRLGTIQYLLGKDGSAAVGRGLDLAGKAEGIGAEHHLSSWSRMVEALLEAGKRAEATSEARRFVAGLPTPAVREVAWRVLLAELAYDDLADAIPMRSLALSELAASGAELAEIDKPLAVPRRLAARPEPQPPTTETVESLEAYLAEIKPSTLRRDLVTVSRRIFELREARDGATAPATILSLAELEALQDVAKSEPSRRAELLARLDRVESSPAAIAALSAIVERPYQPDYPLFVAVARRLVELHQAVHGARSAEAAIAAMRLAYFAFAAGLAETEALQAEALERLALVEPQTLATRDRLLAAAREAAAGPVTDSYTFAYLVAAWRIDRALGGTPDPAFGAQADAASRTLSMAYSGRAFQALVLRFDGRALPGQSDKLARLAALRDTLPEGGKERVAIEDRILETRRENLVALHGKDSPEVEDFLEENLYHYVSDDGGKLTPTSSKERSEFYVGELIRLARLRGDEALSEERRKLYAFYLTAFGDAALTAATKVEELAAADRVGDLAAQDRALDDLVRLYEQGGQPAKAEPLLRRRQAAVSAVYGKESSQASAIHVALGDNLRRQGRDSDARGEYEAALSIRRRVFGAEEAVTRWTAARIAMIGTAAVPGFNEPSPDDAMAAARPRVVSGRGLTGAELADVGRLESVVEAGRHQAGEAAARDQLVERLDALAAAGAAASLPLVKALAGRASLDEAQGEFARAEADRRRLLRIVESEQGANAGSTAAALSDLAALLDLQGRASEAESLHRRANAIASDASFSDRGGRQARSRLAGNLEQQGKFAEAEGLRRVALADGPEQESRVALVHNLVLQGRRDEAVRLFDTLESETSSAIENTERSKDPATLASIGQLLLDLGRPLAAQRFARRLKALQTERLGEGAIGAAEASALLGIALAESGNPQAAIAELAPACRVLAAPGRSAEASETAERQARENAGACARTLAGALRSARPADDAARGSAFLAAQMAENSAAGRALSRAAARAAALAAGTDSLAGQYEATLVERRGLDQRLSDAAAEEQTAGATARRLALADERAALDQTITGLVARLRAEQPDYWELRSPQPVELSALQAPARAGEAPLLRDDELLLTFMIPPGTAKGLVFAVSRHGSAWAELGMTGEQIQDTVLRLRREIDPVSLGVENPNTVERFDRRAAHALHGALLGDPAVQALVARAEVLLVVPSGPLTTLPLSLLVTRPPSGADDDPASRRATAWLLRDKALAVLPTVSSLSVMRRLAEPKRLMERPLQGFADPDFAGGGTSDPPAEAERRSVTRPASRYFRDGNAAQAELRDLPRLPGTRAEGIALVKKLGGDGTSVLFGRDASETRLRQLDADGSLRRARVVAFSTHGLVAGELKNLSQPALALSLPGTGADPDDDGLLTSSEAATLHLNADWVLLSACNTASPDGGNAEGLSGLARAFLFAGARSLLVSHWRVSDAATAVIIGGLFDAGRGQASKAQALRRASLAVLDDATDPEFSDPASWAPFVVIGSPD